MAEHTAGHPEAEAVARAEEDGHGGGGHPSNRVYVGVAAVLAVLTAMEVMVFYVPALRPALVPILMVLMVAKFALVVLFFMHLKADHAIFSGLFSGPVLISVSVVLAVLAMFGQLVGG